MKRFRSPIEDQGRVILCQRTPPGLPTSGTCSALDRAGGQPRDDLPVEEHVDQQRGNRDQQDVHEEQVVAGVELALEVEQGQLQGGVLVAGQEVQRIGEVVEDGHRLDDDDGGHDRAQQRQDDPEEHPQRAGAVDERRLVDLPRDGADEGAEQQDGEGHAEGALDQDQPGHGAEQADLLQQPDGRHDRRRDDQPAEDQEVDDPAPAVGPPLHDVGHHRPEDDEDRDARDRQDYAVDVGDDQDVVARLEHVDEVLDELEVLRPREAELRGVLRVLRGGHQDEGERHQEDDDARQDGESAEPLPGVLPHSSTSRRTSQRLSGKTIASTTTNRITFPAVDRP